ncbi:MAG TPA: carboxylesterase/lipase family protein [Aldersonia sp.]
MASTIDIHTVEGVVRGFHENGIARWRSIPYAAPPVGDLRLRAPAPVQPWVGVRDATRFGHAAIQARFGTRVGVRRFQQTSEDALTLNVTAPMRPSRNLRPVLVFIHGGGYFFGTSALKVYSGVHLARRGDAIVVSMNYRLGAFGYLDFRTFGSRKRPFDANCGLRDQVAALQWVQRNIARFGGDPDNVTLFGESAGANAVVTLLATPSAEGLFHRAIAQSAPADLVIDPESAAEYAQRTVASLGAAPRDVATALASVHPTTLRRAAAAMTAAVDHERPGQFPVGPVVDGDVLLEAPIAAMAAGRAHRVPLIIGTNRDEATVFARYLELLPTTPERIAALFSHSDPAAYERIRAAYPGYPHPRAAIRLAGDAVFWRPTVDVLEAHSRHAAVYNYRYDYAPGILHRSGFGAAHASELIAVFGLVDTPYGRAFTAGGGRRGLRAVTEQINQNWLSFAHSGFPLPSWPRYTEDSRRTLLLNRTSRVIDDLAGDRRLAWRGYRGPYALPTADAPVHP